MTEQPDGQMTVLSLPDHLRSLQWEKPQEIEIRIGGELVVYGLTTGWAVARMTVTCANPDCEGHCQPQEYLRAEIEIAPFPEGAQP